MCIYLVTTTCPKIWECLFPSFKKCFSDVIHKWKSPKTEANLFHLLHTVRPWDARFGGYGKTRVAQNSCNLSYLNKAKARLNIKKLCSLRLALHKFVHLKFFWTLFKNVHCQGPCSLRPCISRPYCIFYFVISKSIYQ